MSGHELSLPLGCWQTLFCVKFAINKSYTIRHKGGSRQHKNNTDSEMICWLSARKCYTTHKQMERKAFVVLVKL